MKIASQSDSKQTDLPIMEQFHTLQGEGFHAGKSAYFIRLGGCDVGCHWCDVAESWDASKHPNKTVDQIVAESENVNSEIIVITGGEPTMYDLSGLTSVLNKKGKKNHLETAGVYPLTGQWDWVCFSPKKFKKPLEEYYKVSHELKVVINHKSDLEWAEGHAAKMNDDALFFLQAEWSKRDKMIPLITEYIKGNNKWRVSLQSHKYLDIP